LILVLLGPPGVGKGTQAARAAEAQGWHHLSTGEILRSEVEQGTPLGEEACSYMDRGDLVPDDVMVNMVAKRIRAMEPKDVLLLDGFPRTLAQAESLAEAAPGGAIAGALYFRAPDSVLEARLLARGREDDSADILRHRLSVFRETTRPLVSWYQEQGVLVEVDADRSIEEVEKDVTQAVASLLRPSNSAH
jgi:adenylate kinase